MSEARVNKNIQRQDDAVMIINVRIFWDFLRFFFINGINACNFQNWCINEKFEKNRTKNAYIDVSLMHESASEAGRRPPIFVH